MTVGALIAVSQPNDYVHLIVIGAFNGPSLHMMEERSIIRKKLNVIKNPTHFKRIKFLYSQTVKYHSNVTHVNITS